MLTPITYLTLTCDGCDTIAETDQGDPCHFTTEAEARAQFALDPHATLDDDDDHDLTRWHFGPDGIHLCPDCQCAAHGHLTHHGGEPAGLHLAAICLRCARWIDLRPADQQETGRRLDDPAARVARVA
jgi:hypothetical protein